MVLKIIIVLIPFVRVLRERLYIEEDEGKSKALRALFTMFIQYKMVAETKENLVGGRRLSEDIPNSSSSRMYWFSQRNFFLPTLSILSGRSHTSFSNLYN